MSNYSKVQFISWELNTGPFIVSPAPGQVGWYSGLLNPSTDKRTDALGQCWDIEARLAFTADAISKAEAVSERSVKTLKVFMAPEFLFRGAGGAYLHDLINGWEGDAPAELRLPPPYNKRWGGLFGGLRSLVATSKYEDWLFVFGTAVSASFPTKIRDGKCVLDPALPGEICNASLIQRGGAMHGAHCYVTRKHYISGIDFLTWNANVRQHTMGTVLPLDPAGLVPSDVMGDIEGGAVFRIPTINDSAGMLIDFGIEICLDHARSGGNYANRFGRIRTAGQFVKIQLVPSGGMSLVPDSVRLQPANSATPFSYAFNCDGLGNLNGTPGSHTQLWNGVYGAPVAIPDRLVEASGGAPHLGTQLVAVAAQLPTAQGPVAANMLWNNGNGVQGAGNVRVITPLEL